MKTLYITDLDGTFLNSRGEISERSTTLIKKLVNDGALFSVATARTKATVLDMFKNIGLNTPIALMNGVSVFDTHSNKTVINHSINKNVAKEILKIYSKYNKHPMLYIDKGDYLEIHYTEIDNIHQKEYINDRKNKKLKKFTKVNEYNLDIPEDLLYIVSFDKSEELEPIYREISEFNSVFSNFYRDNYTDCNFLETMNGNISKGTATAEIKKLVKADKVIAFGDNLNDLPLLEIADEAYAVSNAHDTVKSNATGVIASNDEDAVAEFIYNHYQKSKM